MHNHLEFGMTRQLFVLFYHNYVIVIVAVVSADNAVEVVGVICAAGVADAVGAAGVVAVGEVAAVVVVGEVVVIGAGLRKGWFKS